MRKLIIFLITITLIFSFSKTASGERLIPDEAIRLRVISNSNSQYDQQIKMKVKDELQTEMYLLLKDTRNIDEARNIIKSNLGHFDNGIKDTLDKEKYPLGYSLDFGEHYFPSKKYKGIEYEKGYYESLLVKLGKAEGDNWWCVLFPPLCLLEGHESTEVEYKFFVKEIINKFLK